MIPQHIHTARQPFAIGALLLILIFSCTANSEVNELEPLLEISVGEPRKEQEPPQAVKFTSPQDGTVVTPGQTVRFSLYVNPELQAALVGISPVGDLDIEDINIGRPPWQGTFVVPESESRPIKLRPFVVAIDGGGGIGKPLTLQVTSDETSRQKVFPAPNTAEPTVESEELLHESFPRESSHGVDIIAPTPGSTVKPGEPVTIKLEVDPGLEAEYLQIKQERPTWTGATEARIFPGPPFEATLKVPSEFSGEINLKCTLISRKYGSLGGANILVNAVTDDSPSRIWVWPKVMVFDPPAPGNDSPSLPSTNIIQVSGIYEDNVRRRLNDQVMGTTYRSTNEDIVTVDENGAVRPVAPGRAQIIVENRGAETTVEVIVEKTADANERTQLKIVVRQGEYHHHQNTGETLQKITVINGSPRVRTDSVYLMLENLPGGITLKNSDGVSSNISPHGTPYKDLTPDDGDFHPGDTAEATLKFANPRNQRIEYQPRLIWGTQP